jgi:hypothetical protein
VLLGDSGFAAWTSWRRSPARAGLRHPPAARRGPVRAGAAAQPGTVGRPRTKGARLPNLSDVLADAGTRWAAVSVPGWYGEAERVVEVCSATAVWRHAGLPVVPIRWVLLRDPRHRFDPQALLCTDPPATRCRSCDGSSSAGRSR